jgi:hypothetical protein
MFVMLDLCPPSPRCLCAALLVLLRLRLRPASTPEIAQEDWLNVFVLHQNRVQHGPNAKNCLQERHLPDFLDLVVWGHEHECVPALQVSNDRVGDTGATRGRPGGGSQLVV